MRLFPQISIKFTHLISLGSMQYFLPKILFFKLLKQLFYWMILSGIALGILILSIQALQLRSILFPFLMEKIYLIDLFKYGILSILELLIPISALISTLISYHLFQTNLFALQLYGYSLKTLYAPVMIFALIIGLSQCYLSSEITPQSLDRLRPLLIALIEKRFTSHQMSFKLKSKEIEGVALIYQGVDEKRYFLLILSDMGYLMAENPKVKIQNTQHKESTVVFQLFNTKIQKKNLLLQIGELSLAHVQDLKLKQFSPPNTTKQWDLGEDVHERFIYHRRMAHSLSTVLWILVAVCLQQMKKLSMFQQSLILICAILLFYSLTRFLELKARASLFVPSLAAWLPVVLLLIVFLSVFRFVNKLLH